MKINLMFLVLIVSSALHQYAADKEDAITVPFVVAIDNLNSPPRSTILPLAVSDYPNYKTRLKLHSTMDKKEPQESPNSYTNNDEDTSQARAIASICREFEWHEAAVLYEDDDHGNHFVLSHLNKALGEVEVRLAYAVSFSNSDGDSSISRKLRKLSEKQTRVFIVHMMSPSLGSRFFRLAKRLGLMSEGYAWVITENLSNFMGGFDSITRESMEGVLGLRPPYVSATSSQEFKNSQERKLSDFEIFNVYGSGEKTVGFWSPERGRALRRDLSSSSSLVDDVPTKKERWLGRVIMWPGESTATPKSSAIPASGVLKVGVPIY